MIRLFLLLTFFTILNSAFAGDGSDRFAKVKIKPQKVRGSVHMLEGAGGNIGVSAGEDGILIVDSQFAPLAGRIKKALKGINSGEVEFLLNTHWHGDHTGGNAHLGRHVIAHKNVRKRLTTEQVIKFFNKRVKPADKKAWPVITYDHGLSIHFNGEEIQVVHFPKGHTDGDSIILFKKSKVAHLGDHFFAGRFPFVDLSSGGNALGVRDNIAKMLKLIPKDYKIIPGHGPLSTHDELGNYHQMLKETISTVNKGKKSGKDLAAIKKQGLSKKWSTWGNGFISEPKWIDLIYHSL